MKRTEWIRQSGAAYIARAGRLQAAADRLGPRAVAAFVLFTPRQAYERAVIEFRHYMQSGEVRGSLAESRRDYIVNLPDDNYIRRRAGESGYDWTARLESSIRGLGPAKAPFLVSLLEPTAPDIPVCIDIWMIRLFGLQRADGLQPTVDDYRRAQRMNRNRAHRHGLPPFVYQWAVWDYVRTAGGRSQYLLPDAVLVTDIAADLTI